MATLNVIDFYKDTALTLISLHNAFPRKVEIFVEDIIGPEPTDEFGLHSKRHQGCLGALLWLAEEGYLRYTSTIKQEGIDQVVLSEKSLIKLNTILLEPLTQLAEPNIAEFEANEHLTMSEHMRRALKSGSSEQIIQVMRRFFHD